MQKAPKSSPSLGSESDGPGTIPGPLLVPCALFPELSCGDRAPHGEVTGGGDAGGLWLVCPGPGFHSGAPEVSFLAAAALLHGVQGAHAPVLLEPHPVGEEVLARGLRGGGKQGAHHHCDG